MMFDATQGQFCIPVMEDQIIQDCVRFELLPNGIVRAEVILRDNDGQMIVSIRDPHKICVETAIFEGRGYVINSPGPYDPSKVAAEYGIEVAPPLGMKT